MAKKLITHIDRDNTSPSSKVDINALEASIGAFTTDSENRTVWIDGMPYGNAYIAPNSSNEDPIHSEVFNDFDRENGNKALGDYSHAEGTGTTTFSKGSHAEGIKTTAGLRGFSFAVVVEDKGWKSCFTSDGIEVFDISEGENQINQHIKDHYLPGNILSVLNGKVYTDCIEIANIQTLRGPQLVLKLTDDYIRRGINPFADTFYEANQYSNFLLWCAEKPYTGNVDIGFGSHAEGMNTLAFGTNAHAEGNGTWAADSAHSEGVKTGAYGVAAHAEGSNSVANTNNAHAEGQSTFAGGYNSHSEGRKTVANGNQAHAEGISTIAQGYNSHTEGNNTTAFSNSAHAEGIGTIAGDSESVRGRGSHAEGIGTKTLNDGEHAEGRYNFTEHGIISSVGVGTDGSDRGRKNAITINDAGQIFISSTKEIVGNIVNKYDPCSYDGTSVSAQGVKSLQRILTEAEKKQIPVTYAELLELKENSLLIPGNYYQITDYVTSLHPILEDKAKSAGHKFDLIVTALSENEISENASCKSNNNILESNLLFSDGIVSPKNSETIDLDVFTIKKDNDNDKYPIYEKIGIFTPKTYEVNIANISGLKNISGETEYVVIHGDYTVTGSTPAAVSFIYDFNNDIFCNDDIVSDTNIYIDQLNKRRFIQFEQSAIDRGAKTWKDISSIKVSIPFIEGDKTDLYSSFLYANIHFEKDSDNSSEGTYKFTPIKSSSTITKYDKSTINGISGVPKFNSGQWDIAYDSDNIDNDSQISTFAVNTGNNWNNDTYQNYWETIRPGINDDLIGGGSGGSTTSAPRPTTQTTTSEPYYPDNNTIYETNIIWAENDEVDIDTYWGDILNKLSITLEDNPDNNDTFTLSIKDENNNTFANIQNINKKNITKYDIISRSFVISSRTITNSGTTITIVSPDVLFDKIEYNLKLSDVAINAELDKIEFSVLSGSNNFIFIDDVDIINNKVVLKTTEYINENKKYYNNTSTVYNLETTKVKYCLNNVEANNRFGSVVLGTNINEHIEYAAYKDSDKDDSDNETPDKLKGTLSYFSLGTLYADNLMPPGAPFRDAALSGFENEADFGKYTFRWDSCTTINDTSNTNGEKLYHDDYCILTSSKDSLDKADSTFFAALCKKDTSEIINDDSTDAILDVFKNSTNFTQAILNISKKTLGNDIVSSTVPLVNVPELQYNEYGQEYTPEDGQYYNSTHIKWVSNKYDSYYFETITTDTITEDGNNNAQSTDINIYHTFGTEKYSLLGSEKNQIDSENYFEGVETHTFDIGENEEDKDLTIINRVKIIHTEGNNETFDYWIKLDGENNPVTYDFQDRFIESNLRTLLDNKNISIDDEKLNTILGDKWYIYENIYKATSIEPSLNTGSNLVVGNSDTDGRPYCNTEYHKSINDIINELEDTKGENLENLSSYCYGKFYVICKLTENKQLVQKITDTNDVNKEIPLAFLVKRDMKTTFNNIGGLVSPCLPVTFYDNNNVNNVNNSPLTNTFNFFDYKYLTAEALVPGLSLYENENYFYGLTKVPTSNEDYYLTGSKEEYTGYLAGIPYSITLYNPFTLYYEDTAYSRYISEDNSEQSIIFNKDKTNNIASSICKRVSAKPVLNYYSENDKEIGQLPVYLYTYLEKIRDIGNSTTYASSIIIYKLPFYYSRGFIYDMEDQYRNVLPYDFTNVLQKVNNKWYYTFTNCKDNTDASILGCVRNSKIITSSIQNLFSNVVIACDSSDSRINNVIISSSNNVIINGISSIDGLQIKSCNNMNISAANISNSELSLLTNISSKTDNSLTIDNSVISNLTNNTLRDTSYINRFIKTLSNDESANEGNNSLNTLKPIFSINNFRVFDNVANDIISSDDFYNTSSFIAGTSTSGYNINSVTNDITLNRSAGHKSNNSWNHCRNSVTAQIKFTINESVNTTSNNISGKNIYTLIDNKYLDLGYIVVGTYYKYSDHNRSASKCAPDIQYRFNPTITVTGAVTGTINISGKIDSELVRNASKKTSYYRYFGFKPSIDISQLTLTDGTNLLTYNGQTYLDAGTDITMYITFNPEQIYVGSQNDAGGTTDVDPRVSDIYVYSNTATTENPIYTSYLKNGNRNTIYHCPRSSEYSKIPCNIKPSITININEDSAGIINCGLEQKNNITKNLLVAVCQDGLVTKNAKGVYSLTEGISRTNGDGTRTVYGSIKSEITNTSHVGFNG